MRNGFSKSLKNRKFLSRDKSFYRELLRLTVTVALWNLTSVVFLLSDSLMIGRLGEGAIRDSYGGATVASSFTMLLSGIEGGILVGISHSSGEGDKDGILAVYKLGCVVAAALGIAAAILSITVPDVLIGTLARGCGGEGYLRLLSLSFPLYAAAGALGTAKRAEGEALPSFIAAGAGLVIKLILNYLLIFGKLMFTNLGITGAAIATIAARAAELLVITVFLLKGRTGNKSRARSRTGARTLRRLTSFFGYTYPILIAQVIWMVNTLYQSWLISGMGGSAVASLAVTGTINSLSYVLINGLSGAVAVIIGKTAGRGEMEKIPEYSYTVVGLAVLLGILTSLVQLLLRNPYLSLFDVGYEVRDLSAELISTLSLTVIGTSILTVSLSGLIKSGGDVRYTAKLDAASIFLVTVPLSYLASRLGAPLFAVFLLAKSDQLFKLPFVIKRVMRFDWIKPLEK